MGVLASFCFTAVAACAPPEEDLSNDEAAEADITSGAVYTGGASARIDARRATLPLRFGGHAGDLLRVTVVSATEVPRIHARSWATNAYMFDDKDDTPIPMVTEGGKLVFGLRLTRDSKERDNNVVIEIESKSGNPLGPLSLTVETVEDGVAVMRSFDAPSCTGPAMGEIEAEGTLAFFPEVHLAEMPLRKRNRKCDGGKCSSWSYGFLSPYFMTPAGGKRVTVGGPTSEVTGPASLLLRRTSSGALFFDVDVKTTDRATTTTRTALRCAVGAESCTVVEPIGFPSSALYPNAPAAPTLKVGTKVPAHASSRCFYARLNGFQSTGSTTGVSGSDVASSLLFSATYAP